jgi:hypothetical protein
MAKGAFPFQHANRLSAKAGYRLQARESAASLWVYYLIRCPIRFHLISVMKGSGLSESSAL